MAKKTELAIEATTSVLGYADTIISTVELAASVAIPLSQFIPLIKDVSDIFLKVTDLYRSAQHNKNITRILLERVSAANISVNILQARDDLLTSIYYKSLQRLVRVLRNMEKFIEDITQYNTVQKFLVAKKIESEFKELCKEYDSSMTLLNFNLLVNFNTETEDKIVKEDIEQLIKFQELTIEPIAVKVVTSVDIPLSQFIPLIKDVSDIFSKVMDLYRSAQHNKNITRILMERISAANISVNILQAREDLLTSIYYKNLQRLVQVLHNMKKFIEDITQYNTLQKFLGAKKIENEFRELCKEYDSIMTFLNINLLFNFNNFNTENEDKMVKEDIEQLIKFQEALVESMTDVKQKVSHTNDQMDLVVERVSEMAKTMDSKKDDAENILRTDKLPFEDYEEADKNSKRSERLRKYTHVKTKEEFAFKVVDQDHINDVKNQVTILMKLKDCQNIINFYGLTSDGTKTYLVTEWAEKGNLREYILNHEQNIDIKLKTRIAYDIAKGLNFLNIAKVVHRDIRSENIIITDYEIAKITNFKFSRRFNEATSNIAVNKECVRYSAPEMLRRGVTGEKEKSDKYSFKYDTKCEVYSFGILLWEIAECRIPYEQFEDFMEVTRKVVNGYREKFTPGTDIPKKYQELVNMSIDPNPGSRPIFSKVLADLQDIYKSHSNSLNSNKPPPVQKMTQSIIVPAKDCEINWDLDLYYKIYTEKDENKAFYLYQKEVENGNTSAQYNLGLCYENGIGTELDEKKSFHWYQKAAENENTLAQHSLGLCYENGIGTELDKNKSFHWYQKAAENGNISAQYKLGLCYENGTGIGKNEVKAFSWYKNAAQGGNKLAQYKSGLFYENGIGTGKNDANAFHWYKKAAKGGNKIAQYKLGLFYENGIGTEEDENKAFSWYQKAAENEITSAQFNLGLCYENGIGTKKDENEAFHWYQKAAENENTPAQYNLGLCYENGIGTNKDENKAFHWYQKAAENENTLAQFKLGLCYENGIGTKKDEIKASHWYQREAESRNKDNEKSKFELILKNAGCDKVKLIPYEELENIVLLNQGGFGKIMKAIWTKINNYVICKKLTRTTDLKHDLLDAFIHELKIHLRLDYCNDRIIRCFGICFDKKANDHLLIMQYANDGDLQNYLKNKFVELTWDNKKKLAFQIADGLNYLHNEGILHRDLHSKNIVIHDGNAKITDFGISKIQNSQISTAYIGNFGIIAYMEPKRIHDKNFEYTKASDIYSFGVIMWEISSGRPPFEGNDNILSLGFAIIGGDRETTILGTPEEYEQLYKKCWEQEPEQRPTINEVLDKLERMVKSSNNSASKMEANLDDNYLRIESENNYYLS